eukprot:14309286-Heterocapsa_arctica.AAC.1
MGPWRHRGGCSCTPTAPCGGAQCGARQSDQEGQEGCAGDASAGGSLQCLPSDAPLALQPVLLRLRVQEEGAAGDAQAARRSGG